MDEFDKIVIDKPEKTEDFGDDPEAKRKRELIRDIRLKNSLFFHKNLPLFAKLFIGFIFLLFFVILPISEMQSCFNSAWEVVRDYTRAFIVTGRTALIALATIIVSDLLKRLYPYIIKHSDRDDT